mmetsp:Transcript_2545/g.4805  ORF Transcript_2545/g.4805 Transcript_2545/m.4805 type:complete len:91 (-) Transcript_2545:1093-1365(-)
MEVTSVTWPQDDNAYPSSSRMTLNDDDEYVGAALNFVALFLAAAFVAVPVCCNPACPYWKNQALLPLVVAHWERFQPQCLVEHLIHRFVP